MSIRNVRQLWISIGVVLMLAGVVIGLPLTTRAQEPAPQSVAATIGTAFTYQGQLTDGGSPANGNYDFQFKLYNAASGGSQVGSMVTKSGVAVSDGLFTVQLDFGNVFDGTALWLEIAVKKPSDSGYTTLGRQALTATPYAAYALKAPWSGLTNVPTGFADNTDNDTLGGLSCANGQVAKWNGSAWTCGDDNTGSGSGNAWLLTGNSGTNPTTNFLGTTDSVTLTFKVSNTIALRLEPTAGTPNVIGGYSGNSVGAGVVGATIGGGGTGSNFCIGPCPNQVTADYGTVAGGFGNTASSYAATVGGGQRNTASFLNATVGGGDLNTASQYGATVGGGHANTASGEGTTVGGGFQNTVSGWYATVGGGYFNHAAALTVTIGGGEYISVTGKAATVAGGSSITVTADYASVGGGSNNTAGGRYASVGGGVGNTASGDDATVGGGSGNTASGDDASVGGGVGNIAFGDTATVGGGAYNTAIGDYATVAGGSDNRASSNYATVGGGYLNHAAALTVTIGGGEYISVTGQAATVAGGSHITVTGNFAAVGGGVGNSAAGWAATVPGGVDNSAEGFVSFASGEGAVAGGGGTFVWDGEIGSNLYSSGDGLFVARAPGGFWFGDSPGDMFVNPPILAGALITTSTGAYLSTGGTWTDASDRNLKENFTPVDPQAVLEQVAQLPISTWNYKAEDDAIRHMGPTAQDFYAAFGLGADDKHIAPLDSSGVALAAIQALYERNQALEAENAALRDRVDNLESRLTALEQASRTGPHRPRQLSLPFLSWLGGLLLIGGLVHWQRKEGQK